MKTGSWEFQAQIFFFACRKNYQIWEDFEQVKRGKYRSIIMVLFSVIVNCEKFHAVSQIRNISCSFLLSFCDNNVFSSESAHYLFNSVNQGVSISE